MAKERENQTKRCRSKKTIKTDGRINGQTKRQTCVIHTHMNTKTHRHACTHAHTDTHAHTHRHVRR